MTFPQARPASHRAGIDRAPSSCDPEEHRFRGKASFMDLLAAPGLRAFGVSGRRL